MTGGVDPPVHVHVHLVMAGAFPLRVADLLFVDDALLVVEYAHLTPLSIARGGARRAGETARNRYAEGGIGALSEFAERTRRIDYEGIERVRVHDSRIGRPKIAADLREGAPYAYRIHAPVDVDDLTDALRSLGERRGFAVERRSTLGFRPKTSVRRFLADR